MSAGANISRPSLEKALAAFDMFVLQDQPGDVDEVCSLMDVKPDLMLTYSQVSLLLDKYAAAFCATQSRRISCLKNFSFSFQSALARHFV